MTLPAPASQASLSGASDETLVSLEGISKIFPGRGGDGEVQALAPLDLQIDNGEFLTVVGPSGCGKSTLLSLIAGLTRSDTGMVTIAGQAVRGPYAELGIVFQKDLLMPWRTVLDNVLIQAEVRRLNRKALIGRARQLLELVGLSGFEAYYPHELSGGMRQRVSICRALLHQPPLLLMDEPFAALDAITRDQITLDFQGIWQDAHTTVFFITHNISEAVFLGDRVLVMTQRPGRVAKIMDLDLARPRRLALRETPVFNRYTASIREVFEAQGILRDR